MGEIPLGFYNLSDYINRFEKSFKLVSRTYSLDLVTGVNFKLVL